MENFNNTVKVGNYEIKFRKWKVKDNINVSNSKTESELRNALVYNCLENKNIVLDNEQYDFLLAKIRDASLHTPLKYDFTCEHCDEEFTYDANIKDIYEPIFEGYKTLCVNDLKIELQDVQNREFYEKQLSGKYTKYQKQLFDFALHIKSINGNDTLDFDNTISFLQDLDLDVFEEIFNQWENTRFRVGKIHKVICPHCKNEMMINFDYLPGFFPKSWKLED